MKKVLIGIQTKGISMNWIWRLLAARVDSAITMRLVTFHRALIERGQIEPISPKSNENEHLKVTNAALLDALETVMRFRRGEGEFNFSALPTDQLANESHDRWQDVEQRICAAIAQAKEAAQETRHRQIGG